MKTGMSRETFALKTKARIALHDLNAGLGKTACCSVKMGTGYYIQVGRVKTTNQGWEATGCLRVLQKRLRKYSGSQLNLMAH